MKQNTQAKLEENIFLYIKFKKKICKFIVTC